MSMSHILDAPELPLDTENCPIIHPHAGCLTVNLTNVLRSLLVVLVAAFLGFIGYNLRDTTAKEGGKAPVFSVVTDQGQHVTPTQFGGKVLVLNFWASWCQPCVQEIPSLDQFQRQFAKSGVVVVAVSVDKSDQKYRNFLKRIPVSFETVRDPKADVSAEYGTFRYPETYVIKDGKVLRKFIGEEDWTDDSMTQYVKGLL
jgi:cytochrome c biogenesis protein CcmG/thiol:disulfide interchange protein DsbE